MADDRTPRNISLTAPSPDDVDVARARRRKRDREDHRRRSPRAERNRVERAPSEDVPKETLGPRIF